MTRWIFGTCVLFLASVAVAQQPIVAVKVMPEKSAFKAAAWNKPIVVSSRDAAAKLFGKAELERLAKEVDFQKQFLLVFAWQGSGGDKLNIAIAESFPEQIFFSLKPGVTDDIASHLHVYALRSNVRWSAREDAKKGAAAKPSVRQILGPIDDPIDFVRNRRTDSLTFTNAVEIEIIFGKEKAKAVSEAVDFQTESVVGFRWINNGTGRNIVHKYVGEGARRFLLFHTVTPKIDGIQPQRPNRVISLFAVPAGTKTQFINLDP